MGDRLKKNTTKKHGSEPTRYGQQNRAGNSCEEDMDTGEVREISHSVQDPRNARAQTQKQIQRSAEGKYKTIYMCLSNF